MRVCNSVRFLFARLSASLLPYGVINRISWLHGRQRQWLDSVLATSLSPNVYFSCKTHVDTNYEWWQVQADPKHRVGALHRAQGRRK